MVKKINLSLVLLIVIILFQCFFVSAAQHNATLVGGRLSKSIDEDRTTFFNITVNISDGNQVGNVTNVSVIIWNSLNAFNFTTDSNGTDAPLSSYANHTFTATANVLSWVNKSFYILNGTDQATFWFNLTADTPGLFNITITVQNKTTISSRNITISVNDTTTSVFAFNGTAYDVNGVSLNSTNISLIIKNSNFAQIYALSNISNSTGGFNIVLPGNSTLNYMYELTLTHSNSSAGFVDYVGQSLPAFPYAQFSNVINAKFYLKPAGTINITVINGSNGRTSFGYQLKDKKLGYPVSGCTTNAGNNYSICYVPADRNYSIMIYPYNSNSGNFVPVSFEWNNFTDSTVYNLTSENLSSYNGITKTLQKQFNITERFANIYGYINKSETLNITGWSELVVLPMLSEPGGMVFMAQGILPYNASAWNNGKSDTYTLANGYYNITVSYAPSENVEYILFASGKNGSSFYGGYRNVTITGSINVNFTNSTMQGLLGTASIINMTDGATGGRYIVNTSRQVFNLVNATNNLTLSSTSAHLEVKVDYSSYGCKEFIFMEEIAASGAANITLPLLNITGTKEISVFSQNYAPKRVSTKTVAQITSNPNISMAPFNPQALDGTGGASMTINLYQSNSTCDVPNPPSACSLVSSSNMNTFNPLSAIIGGGKISFRMGMGGVIVHYANVDMLASGPPDALFDNADDVNQSTSGGFGQAMKFGSQGPTIYDYVLVSMPYTEGSSSTTGLNESADVNLSITDFYDENWNVVWNASLNGTNASAFAGNYSHYSNSQSQWQSLMVTKNCTKNVTELNITGPCYVDLDNNKIWIRLPHFSGTQPSTTGKSITAISASSTGSGGGTVADTFWKKTYIATDAEFKEGITQVLSAQQRVRIKVGGKYHHVGITKINKDNVMINVSSESSQALLNIGDIKKFDVTSDGYYDLSVALNSINSTSSKAEIVIKSINETIIGSAAEVKTEEKTNETVGQTETKETVSTEKSLIWLWVLIGIIIVLALAGAGYWIRKRKNRYSWY